MTAPTNKAVKVIQDTAPGAIAATIYSLLGLHMSTDGEVKRVAGMSPDDPQDLGVTDLVVVDEGSMIGRRLAEYIDATSDYNPRTRWIIMGDRWQLPPVKERESPIWGFENRVVLETVMRADNQILAMSQHVRKLIPGGQGRLTIKEDFGPHGGVFVPGDFTKAILADAEEFRVGRAKAVAWRNATVDRLNKQIREELLGPHARHPWVPGELVTTTAPAMGDVKGDIKAYTDEEGTVLEAVPGRNPRFRDYMCWFVKVDFGDKQAVLRVLHERSLTHFMETVKDLAARALARPFLWRDYWEFRDAFHSLRHSYATTAHRAQGSTYDTAYVDWRDILANNNRTEAMRCLYVAVSRPKRRLIMG
jgi:exodeoxyribonuclease-5